MSEKSEAFVSMVGGMNAGVATSLLPATQYAFGLNVSSRGGLIHTRPAFIEREIGLEAFRTGLFQGSASYPLNSADRVVCVISGRVLGIRTDTLEVVDYSAQLVTETDTGLMDATVPRCYFCKADKFMIVQDGINAAMIIDGTTARRAIHSDPPVASDEIPVGTIMAYGHGRLFVVPKTVETQDGRRFFHAGNVMLPTDPTSIFKFTEADTLTGGGAFALPNEMGFITGMCFMRNASTGSGVGALIVMAQRGCSAFAVNASRSTWAEIDISQVLFQGSGTFSPRSLIAVNNDIYYRGPDGIRSLHYAISEQAQGSNGLRNSPISREVNVILQRDSRVSWAYVDTAFVDNRFFCMSVPEDTDEQQFKALVVLDVDVVSTVSSPSSPIYDGAWTGLKFMALAVARHAEREKDALYVFAKKDDGTNGFYMLQSDGYVSGNSDHIPCRLYTKAFHFSDLINTKALQYLQLDLSNMKGNVYMRSFYRPAGHPFWGTLGSRYKMVANPSGREQRRQCIRFSPPDKSGDSVNQTLLSQARAFEFCLQWKGYAQIDQATFTVAMLDEVKTMACGVEKDRGALEGGLDLDPFGSFSVFDEFVSQGEDNWPTYPLIWRNRNDGTVDIRSWQYPEVDWPVIPWTVIDQTEGGGDSLDGDSPIFDLPEIYNWDNDDQNHQDHPFIAVQVGWAEGATGVITVNASAPVASQDLSVRVLSSIPEPSINFIPYGINAGMIHVTQMNKTTINLRDQALITSDNRIIAGLPFYLNSISIRVTATVW